MTHDGDDRRARHDVFGIVGFIAKTDFNVGFGDAFDGVAKFADDEFSRVGIYNLCNRGHDTKLHKCLDDFAARLGHTVGKFLHGDGFGDDNLAHNFFGRLKLAEGGKTRLFPCAFLRGHRAPAVAFVIAVEGLRNCYPFAAPVVGFLCAGRDFRFGFFQPVPDAAAV